MSTDNSNDDKAKNGEEHLDLAEQVQQMRARIAELEGSKDSSSIASFDVLAPIGDEASDERSYVHHYQQQHHLEKHFHEKFAKMEMLCAINKLENKALQTESAHHKLLAEHIELKAKVAKLEQTVQQLADQLTRQQNEHRTPSDDLKRAKESEELKRGQREMSVKIDELAQHLKNSELSKDAVPSKFAEIEKLLAVLKDRFGNELLNAVRPEFRVAISERLANPPQNCWNVKDTHGDLEIFRPECLMLHYKKEGNSGEWPWRSVRAKCSLPSTERLGLFYFEVKIMNMRRYVQIGFATKKLKMTDAVGEHSSSYSFVSSGGYRVNGKATWNKTTFGRDDVVGCGINVATGRLIFTKNGKRLDTNGFFTATDIHLLFPCISMLDSGDLMKANFGPDFKFNLSTV